MIKTHKILPLPLLAPFIQSYIFREFDTAGEDVVRPWEATPYITLNFFFKALPVYLKSSETGEVLKCEDCCDIIGIGTKYNGEMVFNGNYFFLEINFKPGGFARIFNIYACGILNRIVCAKEIFGYEIKQLYKQLRKARNLKEMAMHTNVFLLNQLNENKHSFYKDRIVNTSNVIFRNSGIINITQLATIVNMSIRNLERYFIQKIGLSPKLLCSIIRFHHAFSLKLNCPQMSWTSIAYSCGYFDQMHLIREFKRFSGNTPTAFLNETPLTQARYINKNQ